MKRIIKSILSDYLLQKIIKIKRKFKFISENDIKKIKNYSEYYPEIFSVDETIEWIIKNNGSIARYGDGEFQICLGKNTSSFQRYSKNLKIKLIKVLAEKNDDFLVCIPPFNSKYNNTKNYCGVLSFWEYYWLKNFKKIKPFLKHKKYGNSFVSRDNLFYESDLERIKKIWANRKVVFVYGNNGRFEIKPELFGNIKEYQEIKVSPKNAFQEYDFILKNCLEYSNDHLFLLAIGQTATVLSFDLYKNGYQAIDIGHFPNSYDQYLGKIVSPERVPIIKKS